MGGDQEISEESYLGSFIERGDKKYLSYKRTTEDGVVDCLISFNRKEFTLTQKGSLSSKIELKPGQKTVNKYSTSVGNLSIEIFTRRYELIEQKDDIRIGIEYDIITGPDSIQTTMDIKVKIKGEA
jgi:uncharacterized beta-barrel protein YwiB (DUF1934 family)